MTKKDLEEQFIHHPNSLIRVEEKIKKESGRCTDNYTYSASIDGPGELINDEMVEHPAHYGGEDNPYEAIKVIEAWGVGFNLGNAIKYISRVGKKLDTLEDLKKASWYINREINKLKNN